MKMKKIYTLVILLFLGGMSMNAQDSLEVKPVDRPVPEPWDSYIILDNQTTLVQPAKTLEMFIGHRFGLLNQNGISDLFGVYAPGANIRMGLNYTIIKNVSVGYGITLKNMYSDFSAKWNIFEQTRKNTMPVAVTLFANMAINGKSDDNFGTNYQFTDRLSYFTELMVGRKFADWCTIQASLNFTHFNKVDSAMDHDALGLGFLGQFKFTSQSSFVLQYNIPLKIRSMSEHNNFNEFALPNLAFGYQVTTATHSFQVFVGTANGIIPADNFVFNQNDWTKGEMMIGFTITRRWGF